MWILMVNFCFHDCKPGRTKTLRMNSSWCSISIESVIESSSISPLPIQRSSIRSTVLIQSVESQKTAFALFASVDWSIESERKAEYIPYPMYVCFNNARSNTSELKIDFVENHTNILWTLYQNEWRCYTILRTHCIGRGYESMRGLLPNHCMPPVPQQTAYMHPEL